ncbi:MAG: hypothetical protein ACRDM8_04040, partial [Gaiellaceae bacterium]
VFRIGVALDRVQLTAGAADEPGRRVVHSRRLLNPATISSSEWPSRAGRWKHTRLWRGGQMGTR